MILNPSASHFAFGKQRVRERFVLEGSRAFGVTYIYAKKKKKNDRLYEPLV